jgi:hypothetical protein
MVMKRLRKCSKRNYRLLMVLIVPSCFFSACSLFFEDSKIRPEKVPLLRIGDTIVYISESQTDSFYVKNARLYKPGEIDSDYERFKLQTVQFDFGDSCYRFGATITPSEYIIGIANKEYDSINNVQYEYSSTLLFNDIGNREINLYNYQIDDLYECKTRFNILSGDKIGVVLYSKKYGFVEYSLTSGEKFQITEESLEMLMARE